jgi:Mrp family chromosome partitioning ATPase
LALEQNTYIINCLYDRFKQQKQVFLLLGPTSGVGASYCCREIAAAAVALLPNLSVVLVDMNIHHPSLSETAGSPAKGWASWLMRPKAYPLNEAVVPWSQTGKFDFLPLGDVGDYREAAAQLPRWPMILDELKKMYDLILMDVPAFYQGAEARVLCRVADDIIVVIEADGSRKLLVHQMVVDLQRADASILGVVFNKRRLHIPRWIYKRLFASS